MKEAEIKRIIELYNNNKTFEEIAKELGKGRKRIGIEVNKLIESGELEKRGTLHKTTLKRNSKYETVIAMYNDGKTYEEIGNVLGCHETRVSVMVKRLRQEGIIGVRQIKRKSSPRTRHIPVEQRTDEVWNEKGIKCTCKVSNTCVFGYTFACNKPMEAKCDFIGRQGHSRPKAEDGLCHSYQKITYDNPRRQEVAFNAFEGNDIIWKN